MKPRSTKAIRKAALAALYAAIFGLTLEGAARVDDYVSYGAPLLGNYALEDLREETPGGIQGKPGARFEKWKLNSLGLQGPEVSAEKRTGHLRVLVLGASESFGLYETPGKSYPARLQELLAAQLNRPVEVLNGALPGMSLPRVVRFCERRLDTLRPDVVIYYPTPAAYLDVKAPSLEAAGRGRTGNGKSGGSRPKPRLLRRGWQLVKASLPTPVEDWLRRREIAQETSGEDPSWLFREVPRERLDLFEQHLSTLIWTVRESGARLVLATHANRFREPLTSTERRQLLAWRQNYPRAEEEVILAMDRQANAMIRRLAADEDLPVADIAAAVPPEPRLFADFVHFTDAGSELAARALAETIAGDATASDGAVGSPGRSLARR